MKEWSITDRRIGLGDLDAEGWTNSLSEAGWEIDSVTPLVFPEYEGRPPAIDVVVIASRERKYCANGCGTILGDHRDEFCSACAREIESSTCSVTGCDQPAFENGLCACCALDATLYSEPGSEHEGFSEER